jgi:quercetin dioxygenase-like cupin family protein
MPFIELSDSMFKEPAPKFKAAFVHSGHMTLAHWIVERGAVLPEHSHVHEQVVNVIEGEFEMNIAGESKVLSRGLVAVIPSNVIHSGKALTECRIIDAFYPVREDYR